jgi:hypothetical protein
MDCLKINNICREGNYGWRAEDYGFSTTPRSVRHDMKKKKKFSSEII